MNGRSEMFLFPRMRWGFGVLAVLALLLAACSSGAGNTTPTSGAAGAPATIVSTNGAAVATTVSTMFPTNTAGTPSGSETPMATGAVPATGATVSPTGGVPGTGGTAAAEAMVNVVSDPKYGNILVDGNGMTLYVFAKDTPDKSNCSASCLKLWPPLLTQGNPVAGQGADRSMLAWTALADGSRIVTYNHMPLYRFSGDKKAGDTNGQGLNNVWHVVSPDGKPVTGTGTTGAPAGGGTGGYGG